MLFGLAGFGSTGGGLCPPKRLLVEECAGRSVLVERSDGLREPARLSTKAEDVVCEPH